MERGFLSRLRAAGLCLALCALVFKAMLPPGFMLDTGGDRIAITLCNGAAATLDLGDHDGKPVGDTSQHCPFAFAATPALDAPPVIALAAPTFVLVRATAPVRAAIGEHDHTGPPLPARSPPLQA